MATISRTDIPCLIGTRVELCHLKNGKMNKKCGLVVGWNDSRKRFKVQLDCNENSIKSFKPCNLRPEKVFKNFMTTVAFNFVFLEKKVDLDLGENIFDQISLPFNRVEFYVKIWWLAKCFIPNLSNSTALKKIRLMLNETLEMCNEYPDFQVWIKCIIAQSRIANSDIDESHKLDRELLMPCLQNHYGFLPFLARQLLTCLPIGKLTIDIYHAANDVIENKTYHVSVSHADFDIIPTFLLRALDVLTGNLYVFKNRNDVIFECEKILTKYPEANRSDTSTFICLARIYFFRGQFERAIEKISQYLKRVNEIMSTDLMAKQIAEAFALKLKCYAKLGNQKMARKCLNRVRKYDVQYHQCDLTKLENLVHEISTNGRSQKNSKLKSLTKCSYFNCEEIETYIGEFMQCSRCRVAIYCCKTHQKKHWKRGHKERCCVRDN